MPPILDGRLKGGHDDGTSGKRQGNQIPGWRRRQPRRFVGSKTERKRRNVRNAV